MLEDPTLRALTGKPHDVSGREDGREEVSTHRKLERQFQYAQRLDSIATFACGVAHDLNNILAPILMSVRLLREGLPPDLRDEIVSTIEASAQRGADVIKQVLIFARGTDGPRVLIQPSHLVKEMATIAQGTYPKTIAVRVICPATSSPIRGDPAQLNQALLNLCGNARDAMPDGGAIKLAVENVAVDEHFAKMIPGARPGPHVLIQVSDTGSGIPHEIIDRIFDPFFTTKPLGKGAGLGLSTAAGIVRGHGGFMNVYSEVGHGTTFKVFLPADEAPAAPAGTPEHGDGELILVVDDERGIRETARIILKLQGYRVLVAENGVEALALFAAHVSDVRAVLTDIMMPQMDGISLIRAMREIQPGVVFIASTGRSDDKRMVEIEAPDVPYTLIKPYSREALLAAVHDALASVPRRADS